MLFSLFASYANVHILFPPSFLSVTVKRVLMHTRSHSHKDNNYWGQQFSGKVSNSINDEESQQSSHPVPRGVYLRTSWMFDIFSFRRTSLSHLTAVSANYFHWFHNLLDDNQAVNYASFGAWKLSDHHFWIGS